MSPTSAGGFLTIAPPGKPSSCHFLMHGRDQQLSSALVFKYARALSHKTGLPLTSGASGKGTTPQKAIRRKTTWVEAQPRFSRGLQTALTRTHNKECICTTIWFTLTHTHTHTHTDRHETLHPHPRKALLSQLLGVLSAESLQLSAPWTESLPYLHGASLLKVTPLSRGGSCPVRGR